MGIFPLKEEKKSCLWQVWSKSDDVICSKRKSSASKEKWWCDQFQKILRFAGAAVGAGAGEAGTIKMKMWLCWTEPPPAGKDQVNGKFVGTYCNSYWVKMKSRRMSGGEAGSRRLVKESGNMGRYYHQHHQHTHHHDSFHHKYIHIDHFNHNHLHHHHDQDHHQS